MPLPYQAKPWIKFVTIKPFRAWSRACKCFGQTTRQHEDFGVEKATLVKVKRFQEVVNPKLSGIYMKAMSSAKYSSNPLGLRI